MNTSKYILIATTMLVLCVFISKKVFNKRKIEIEDCSITEVMQRAKDQQKLIWISLVSKECSLCKKMDDLMFSSDKVIEKLDSNFLVLNIDIEKNENRYWPQILYSLSTPLFIVLDSCGEVRYVHSGLISEGLENVLQRLVDNQSISSHVNTNLYSSGADLRKLYSNVFKSWFILNKDDINKNDIRKDDLRKGLKVLNESLCIEKYSMNYYLAYLFNKRLNNNKEADINKSMMLKSANEFDRHLYGNYIGRSDIKKVNLNSKKSILKITKREYDLGRIKKDDSKDFAIQVQNIGDKPIIINKIDSSCGCIEADWDKKPLIPRAGLNLDIEFKAKNSGKFYKVLFIYSNAENSPSKIILKGKVI